MEPKLKKFTLTNKRYEDRITVTGTRSFGFPTTFYNKNNISSFKYVILFYDEEQKIVGLQFTNNEEEEHKFSILKSNKGYGGNVIASSFFRSYNIDPKIYKGRYIWEKKEYPDLGTVFLITLKEREQINKPVEINTAEKASDSSVPIA